jgi:hypothetical protein
MGEEITKHIITLMDHGTAEPPPPLEAELIVRFSAAPPGGL